MKILQFGTGRFLRGFFAPIVTESKSITVVQSRVGSTGAQSLNAQPDGYHVWTRGIENGKMIDQAEWIESIDKGLVAKSQWDELCQVATSSELELVVSNTTAAGLSLDESDDQLDFLKDCPESFPAKLVALLFLRFRKSLAPLTILPLELVEQNADRLKQLVLEQAKKWAATNTAEFIQWVTEENRWLNNLVDRIVVGPTSSPPWQGEDINAVVGEPFRMLAIQDDGRGRHPVPENSMVTWTEDLAPYFLRKVRILNGLHTAMVAKFLPQGVQTVLQCVTELRSREWLLGLLNEEILPALVSRGLEEKEFADQVIERFENPFFEHKLADIANGHESKLPIRIQPTFDEFVQAFGKTPEKLNEVLQTQLTGV